MTIRVHELAKELKISTMALKKHLTDLGVNVKSHMSLVEDEVADKIRLKYKEQIDAEKRAERDRKRLIEMRQAAKAQKSAQEAETIKAEEPVPPVVEPVKEVPKKEEPKPVKEPEKETPIPVKEKPVEVKPEEKPHKPAPEKPKAVPKPKPEVIPPKTAAPAKPEPWKKQEPSAPSIKPIPTPPSVEIKKEEKKFGKAKISHEELGEKSKHKKAIISSTKKAKQKLIETIEIDEAEISRNIKKTLQKSSKRKKYHREAQYVEDRSNEIVIREFTSVSELAKIMNVSPSDIISKFFMMGQLVTMNQRLDRDSLEMICDEFKVDYRFEDEYGMDIIDKEREQYNNVKEEPRPPVVTIMGHVDHGKTSILDYIRNTNVVAGESGNITQHIGAYQIEINKHKITFLDTPGHEAFTAMRARGANVTDIAVIVISATEGVKAQTREAIDHAKAAGVSIILAINKVDLPEANVDKVIAQLMEIGVYPEQYGGDIPWCRTSVVTGEGILNLIELILLTAEILELKAKRDVPASGVVIEAGMDARMGPFATILMQEGTLHKGDIVVCGAVHGRIRKMENERGAELKVLYPSDVARVYGLSDTPKAGDILNQVDSEKTARNISTERQQIRLEREKYQNKSSLQNIFARIKEEQINTLNIILKTDTDGSAEALADSFQKLSNEEVSVNIIHKSVGGISEADVSLAAASDAIIIGFHVRPSHQARKLAEEEGVQIKLYQVIYDVIDDLQNALEGMLKPKYEEQVIGSAIVKQVFKIKRVGTIAGCQVDKGVIQANCKVRLYRNDVLVTEDTISSLKHYADDVKEVRAGSECGLTLANFSDIKEDDVLEAYIVNEVNKKL
ncbi:MAG TPA: translation initiation factor IF-2 [Candidatus Cloacimonas acidaminovorans]|nr:translation initiation factor IF-2 [Candidatus Cloacimonas acidaminovorans]HRS60495.1 translation initiation factor IF-2 [Candidatus Cloacimonas sp.]HOM78846.1 translation initiation factor IF-2 [Candidatus Cloacimonas acidaminovorans]HOS06840.1 translation initiation factor IF-2 [Candidatus Cloacimonas acidaminovorans]HOT38239.1 translation initiation factor IF-2 [Candidatus Cloacimonas acidaminovorans]